MFTLTLSSIAALSATLLAIWSIFEVWRRIRLENRLKVKLADKHYEWIRKDCYQKKLMNKLAKQPPSDEAISEARTLVLKMIKDLDNNEKKIITQGIYQPSPRGQADYIAKLLNEVGHCDK